MMKRHPVPLYRACRHPGVGLNPAPYVADYDGGDFLAADEAAVDGAR
jgi:hypothetical protein